MAEKLQSALGRIQILSQAFDSWIVEFRIELNELLDNERLLHHLRGVKQVISSSQSIPENSLLFDGIVRKVNDGEWVDVVVRIKKRVFVSGAPRVTLLEKMDSNGATYSNVIAVLDLFYLDEFENAITLDRVMRAIRGANIAGHLVDNDILSGKIAEVLATQMPIKGIPIAQGKLPASGKDATLAFYFQAYANSSDVDTLYSSRRVRKGDILCRKSIALEGERDGYNVFGNAIVARAGSEIALVAGVNAELSIDELDVVASTDGVVVVSRVTRTLRTLNGIKEQPVSVTIKVDPILKLDGNVRIDLTTAHAVEVSGNLIVGSRILAQGEVFVRGNVEHGASIVSSDDILIRGNVEEANSQAKATLFASQSVIGADVQARLCNGRWQHQRVFLLPVNQFLHNRQGVLG
ncbi:MAG: DUF342 domain-containing protein [bacterium]|nr:DUF342 domain-containing protein [bacterium]